MERTASFVWYGPFVLLGKRGDPAEKRLREIANFQGATKGLYLLVGSARRALIRPDQVLYIGQTGKTFLERLRQHLDPARGDQKIHKVESCGGRVTSIWLASLASSTGNPLDSAAIGGENTEDDEESGPSAPYEIGAYEKLLIHLALRSQNNLPQCSSDHFNRNGFKVPSLNMVMLNRFNTDSWEHKNRPKWRPTMIPDIIDCHVEGGDTLAQLIWTGTRGCAMQRRECRPGRLMGARRSEPRKGPSPTL